MPVMLDVGREVAIQAAERDLSKGVELVLDPAQRSQVIMTKYINDNPLRADWQPEGHWFEQVIVDVGGRGRQERIQVAGLDGKPRGLTVDDGLIVDLDGTLTRKVGILPRIAPMSLEEVDAYRDSNPNEVVPVFQQWDFRIVRVLKTDGPAQRSNLTRSEEQKRLRAQTEMFDAFKALFEQGLAMRFAEGDTAPSAQAVFEAAAKRVKGDK